MADCQVTCINKPDRSNRHEHITHIGNIQGGWKITRESAIQRIKNGTDTFYTVDPRSGRRVDVRVVDANPPYLRTYADGVWTDNLLALSECGSNCKVVS